MLKFSKQPTETYTIGISFDGKLPTGTSILSGVAVATDPAGSDVSGTVLGPTVSIVGTEARFRVKSGTHGVVYRIQLLVTLDSTDVLEEDVEMTVENL